MEANAAEIRGATQEIVGESDKEVGRRKPIREVEPFTCKYATQLKRLRAVLVFQLFGSFKCTKKMWDVVVGRFMREKIPCEKF